MFERRSKRWPITLGVVMIVLTVIVTIGWVLVSLFGAFGDDERSLFYWIWLPIGAVMLVMILVGVVLYLTLSIKAINLNERQSNFIDSVTHELKSPIASLKLYLQTLRRRNVTEEERNNFYKFMVDDLDRLDNLISNLLDVARLDRGDAGGSLVEDVSLDELLLACAESTCSRHNVPPEVVQLETIPCRVTARRVDLEMIFRNLIDNAIKYAGESPEVTVKCRIVPDRKGRPRWATVEIADNGRGVPPVMRRRIFGRFVRSGRELEREKPGIGLGLYIVRILVDRLRGRIRVIDRPEGTGAVFEVQLPCKPTAEVSLEPAKNGGA